MENFFQNKPLLSNVEGMDDMFFNIVFKRQSVKYYHIVALKFL